MSQNAATTPDDASRSALPLVVGVGLLGSLGIGAMACFVLAAGLGLQSLTGGNLGGVPAQVSAAELEAAVLMAPTPMPEPEPPAAVIAPAALVSAAPLAIPALRPRLAAAANSGDLAAATPATDPSESATPAARSTRRQTCSRRVPGSSRRVAYSCDDHPAHRR